MPREELLAFIVRGLLFASLVLLMVPIERLWPARHRPLLRRGILTDAAHFFLNPIAVGPVLALAFAGLDLMLAPIVPGRWRAFFDGLPFPVQLLCILFIGEMFTYWIHRLSHTRRFFWRFHAVHHSSEDVDWLSAHRQHPFDAILFVIAANVPAVALGFGGPMVAFVAVFHRAFVTFTHASVSWRLPWLKYVLVTPRFHHQHHDRDAPPSNFAGLFPVFDMLFGTYCWPHRLPAIYGVDHRIPNGWLGQLVLPLIRPPELSGQTNQPAPYRP